MADLNCGECLPRNDTAYELKRSRRMRDDLGCEKDALYPVFTNSAGEEWYRCPIKSVPDYIWSILDFYGFYEQGYLPCEGGIMDQPNILMDCFSIIKREKISIEKEKN